MGARKNILYFRDRRATYFLLMIGCIVSLVFSAVGLRFITAQPAHAATTDWSTFLGSNARTGYDSVETIINPTNASSLKTHWIASTAGHAKIASEVIVANGMLYWGSWDDGILHASDPTTGKDIWTASLGTIPGGCSHKPKGVISSVTVATVLFNGTPTSIVFVGAGQSNLYALDALKGTILWKTNLSSNPVSFLFSSTAFYNGSIYIGVASTGDCPLVQGAVVRVDASTGLIQNTFNIVPNGCIGGSVWGTPAIDEQTGMLYFGTGNVSTSSCTLPMPLGLSVVELKAADLSLVSSWHIPRADMVVKDVDFGSSPTLFQASINGATHEMLGIVNKDGYYYALDRNNISAGPLWKLKISVGGTNPALNASIAAGAFDGVSLYVAGSSTTLGGQSCAGSLSAVDPGTGTTLWADCLTGSVQAPVLAVPGLVVIGAGNNMDVVNSQTGQILYSYQDTALNGTFWGAATISNGILYDGSKSGNLFAFGF